MSSVARASLVLESPPTHALARLPALLRPLRVFDPGLLRLTQAFKTLAAVLIVLALFHSATLQTKLFGGIGAGFLMQCTSTGTRRRQQLTMSVTAICMIAAVGLGSGLSGHPRLQDALLVALAFIAFYVRRFLPDQNMFPVFGFVLCLLATALPAGWERARGEMLALAVAFPVAFGIFFYVAPPDRLRAFADALEMFFARSSEFLRSLSGALRTGRSPDRRLPKSFQRLRDNVSFNQQLLDQWPGEGRHPNQIGRNAPPGARDAQVALITELLLREYESLQAISMLEQSVTELTQVTRRKSPPVGPGTSAGECSDSIPPELLDRLAALMLELSAPFHRLSRALRGSGHAALALRSPPAEEHTEHLVEVSQLQVAMLESRHPLCPEMAHLFTAVVASRELWSIQRRLAVCLSVADASALRGQQGGEG